MEDSGYYIPFLCYFFFSGGNREENPHPLAQQVMVERKDSLSWKEMLDVNTSSPGAESQERLFPFSDENVRKILLFNLLFDFITFILSFLSVLVFMSILFSFLFY